jgi:hypothetical protein
MIGILTISDGGWGTGSLNDYDPYEYMQALGEGCHISTPITCFESISTVIPV